jgi:hypothetical protein
MLADVRSRRVEVEAEPPCPIPPFTEGLARESVRHWTTRNTVAATRGTGAKAV